MATARIKLWKESSTCQSQVSAPPELTSHFQCIISSQDRANLDTHSTHWILYPIILDAKTCKATSCAAWDRIKTCKTKSIIVEAKLLIRRCQMFPLFQYIFLLVMHNARVNGISCPSCQFPFWKSTAPPKFIQR